LKCTDYWNNEISKRIKKKKLLYSCRESENKRKKEWKGEVENRRTGEERKKESWWPVVREWRQAAWQREKEAKRQRWKSERETTYQWVFRADRVSCRVCSILNFKDLLRSTTTLTKMEFNLILLDLFKKKTHLI
jgi:hypothetical protein